MNYFPDIRCPLTTKIFWEPVVASDGNVYEKTEIKKWIKEKKPSPTSNRPLQKDVYPLNFLKENISGLLEKNPELCEDLYQPSYEDHQNSVKQLIKNGQYDQLNVFINFDLEDMVRRNTLPKLIRNAPNNIIKYVIDNSINLDFMMKDGSRFLHFLIKYCDRDVVEYILDKDINIDCTTREGLRPIHLLCQQEDIDNLKLIVSKGVQLEVETRDGWRPIHFACYYSDSEMIQYLIDQDVDLSPRIKKLNGTDSNCTASDLLKLNKELDDKTKEYLVTLMEYKQLYIIVEKNKNKMKETKKQLDRINSAEKLVE